MDEFKELWEQVLVKYVFPHMNDIVSYGNIMAKAFQYCVIMRTDEGIEEFLDYNDVDYSQFFRYKIINLLGLKDEPESDKKVVEYLLSIFKACSFLSSGSFLIITFIIKFFDPS